MIKIENYLKYEGGEIRPQHLYTYGSEDIVLEGKVDFTVFGSCSINGVKVQNVRLHMFLAKPTVFKIFKDSAILFNQAPCLAKDSGEHVPVPDVPDMMDQQTRQMHMMFQQWAQDAGLVPEKTELAEGVDQDSFDDDFDDDEFDLKLDIDQGFIPEDNIVNISDREADYEEAKESELLESSSDENVSEEESSRKDEGKQRDRNTADSNPADDVLEG
jgi:hypothetical protein